jgi:hypothetical protein
MTDVTNYLHHCNIADHHLPDFAVRIHIAQIGLG